MTFLYAAAHFLVDFLCAWAMFASFREGEYGNFLIYNFCAFALQMPFGTLLDLLRSRSGRETRHWMPFLWTLAGMLLTVLGALLHPAVLGVGNALFHVGGGMDVIGEDFRKDRRGSALGLFVAPGALGLYFGTLLGKRDAGIVVLLTGTILLFTMASLLRKQKKTLPEWQLAPIPKERGNMLLLVLYCFLVVVLRSWVGLAVSFSWKSKPALALLAVACVAAGKMLGGFVSARWGIRRTAISSLILAACCYLLGEIPGFGLLALLLFNMSMPVTLYLLAVNMPQLPGFSLGLLTFGLFLGFLPVYAGVELPVSGPVFGLMGGLASLILLAAAGKAVDSDRVSA